MRSAGKIENALTDAVNIGQGGKEGRTPSSLSIGIIARTPRKSKIETEELL